MTGLEDMNRIKKTTKILIIVLLALFFLQAVTSMSKKSLTFDELSHIPAGYSYINTMDYRLNPEHPPLIKMIAGIPLVFINPSLPLAGENWEKADQWGFGNEFFFEANKGRIDQIVFWARVPIVLLGIILGIFVFMWARDLYGEKAGLFALLLYSFSPNILAHTRLVTTDLGITLFIFVSCYYFYRFLEHKQTRDMILCGVSIGLALGAKYTGLYLVLIFAILFLCYLYLEHKLKMREWVSKSNLNLLLLVIAIFGVGFLVLVLTYGVTGFPTYLKGFESVASHSLGGHNSFLMGMHSTGGWLYYFIVAFFIKTPIPTLIFLFLAIVFFKRLRNKKTLAELFLIIPPLVIFILFTLNKINIGLRHVLAIYPFIFVFSSKLVNLKDKWKYVLGILLIWYVIGSIIIYPNYLAYFNGFVGGPDNGHNYLIDSNIDWGQDFNQLKLYIEKNNIDDITIGFYAAYEISELGLEYNKLKCYPTSGVIAVTVNALQGFTEEDKECLEWLRKYEPVDNIGHSILIYDIKDEFDQKELSGEYCRKGCINKCEERGSFYFNSSSKEGKCQCQCSEAFAGV